MDIPLPFFIFTPMIRAVLMVFMLVLGVLQTGLFAQFPVPASSIRLLEMSEEFARSSGIARQEALEWAIVKPCYPDKSFQRSEQPFWENLEMFLHVQTG